jgi:hypothetical protein
MVPGGASVLASRLARSGSRDARPTGSRSRKLSFSEYFRAVDVLSNQDPERKIPATTHIDDMKALLLFIGWCLLFVLCWPIALIALILLPVVWLVSLPLRLVGITIEALFAFVRTLLFLPARVLGWRKSEARA